MSNLGWYLDEQFYIDFPYELLFIFEIECVIKVYFYFGSLSRAIWIALIEPRLQFLLLRRYMKMMCMLFVDSMQYSYKNKN